MKLAVVRKLRIIRQCYLLYRNLHETYTLFISLAVVQPSRASPRELENSRSSQGHFGKFLNPKAVSAANHRL